MALDAELTAYFEAEAHGRHRVALDAGLVGVTGSGRDFEGAPEVGEIRPYRFFSLRSHDRWRRTLEEYGRVETFRSFDPHAVSGWEYQFAVIRAAG